MNASSRSVKYGKVYIMKALFGREAGVGGAKLLAFFFLNTTKVYGSANNSSVTRKMPNGIIDRFFSTVLEWQAIANPHLFSSYYIKYDLLTP